MGNSKPLDPALHVCALKALWVDLVGDSQPPAAPRDSCLWSGHKLWNNPLLLGSEGVDISECHFLIKETVHLPLSFDLSWNNSHKSPGNTDVTQIKWKRRKLHLSLINGKRENTRLPPWVFWGRVIFRKEHFVILVVWFLMRLFKKMFLVSWWIKKG